MKLLPPLLHLARRAHLLLAAAACAGSGWAQAQGFVPTLQPSLAQQCMTPADDVRGQPEYPADLLARKDGGLVQIELVFEAPDAAPIVRLIDSNADRGLEESVRRHVRKFRVPCMRAGDPPARLVQRYSFVPNDGRKVMASPVADADEAQRRSHIACMTRILPGERPAYPFSATSRDLQGKFLLQLRFTSPQAAPEVAMLDADNEPTLLQSVQDFVKGFRMPCLGDRPVELTQLYIFHMQGGERLRLKDTPLLTFLGNAKSLPLPAFFDFNTMACPFDLRVTYARPFDRNSVQELDASVPARRPLLEWLAGITLDLSPKQNRAVLGESMTLSVPCGKLDL